jgi:hypothetical protein
MAVGNFIPSNVQSDMPRLAILHVVLSWTGGVASVTSDSYGATSVSGSSGEWTVTVRGSFAALLGASAMWMIDGGGAPTCPVVTMNSVDVQTGAALDFATFKPTAADNTALILGDPGNTERLAITLFLLNT